MATVCCICESKIGAFDKPRQLVEGASDLPVCLGCSERLMRAEDSDISPENQMLAKQHRDAVSFLAGQLASKPLDPRVAAALEALPGVADARRQAQGEAERKEENERRYREERDSVMVTTGYSFDGYRVTGYHEVVSADAIVGTGPIAETAAALTDLVGERSNALGGKVASAKAHAYADMLKAAILAGGNAVLGVSYDVYVVGTQLGASVTGTSVTVEPE